MPATSAPELIAQKTRHVAARVVLGRRARRGWPVYVYYGKQILSALLTFAGGLGIGSKSLGTPDLSWPFWAGVAALAGAACLELYRLFGIEQAAVQSLAAGRAFALVEKKLGQALEEQDPTAQLNLVAEEAKALELNFYAVLPRADHASHQEAEALADELLARHKAGWAMPSTAGADEAQPAPPASARFRELAGADPVARFKLDETGVPEALPGPGAATSYAVEVSLPAARPAVTSVTYVLDGSYYDPLRVSDDAANGFRREITAAGDFLLEVRAQAGPDVAVRRAWLSELLAAGHQADRGNPAIAQALRSVEEG